MHAISLLRPRARTTNAKLGPSGGRSFRSLAVAAEMIAVTACAAPRVSVDPSGRMEVLGPEPGFSPASPPPGWVHEGDADGRVEVVSQGVPALRVRPGDGAFVFARRTDAVLLAAPYLSWAWNMDAQRAGPHPVRIVVGFHGGDPKSPSWGSQPLAWLGSVLLPHDRVLMLVWGESVLARGDLSPVVESASAVPANRAPRFTVRGGRENAGQWWVETADRADLYSRAWPRDDHRRVRIVFVGIASAVQAEAGAHVSGIVLSRLWR